MTRFNPFGLRFAPGDLITGGKRITHPLKRALLLSENGEDERGALPVNNTTPDRLQVVRPDQGLDNHGWPDRFGFLESTQALFTPIGGPADDCVACAVALLPDGAERRDARWQAHRGPEDDRLHERRSFEPAGGAGAGRAAPTSG